MHVVTTSDSDRKRLLEMDAGGRRCHSGEIFPGRRHSLERTMAQLASSNRLGVPGLADHLRRASLQTDCTSCRLVRDELMSSSHGGLQTGSSTIRVQVSPIGSPDLASLSTREIIPRRVSCVAGGLTSSHGSSRGTYSREPTIFDIGADYMKVNNYHLICSLVF